MSSLSAERESSFVPFLPGRMRILSGSALKLLAVVAMICDHVSIHLLRFSSAFVSPIFHRLPDLSVYSLLHGFGRIAFPIYAFLLVEGFFHTKSKSIYAKRLAIFALISEIPWNLEHSGSLFLLSSQNVFFTLLAGFLGICLADRIRKGQAGKAEPFALAALLVCSFFAGADYGAAGFGFILILYFLRTESFLQAIAGSSVLSAKWKGALAFLLINMYNGERGFIQSKFLKYLFYAIYPAHITVIWLIKRKLGFL